MSYVRRNSSGDIDGVFENVQPGIAEEFVEGMRPSLAHTVVNGRWVIADLAARKNNLIASVETERARRWRAGFPVQIGGVTKWFHSDEFSLTQHLGLKDKARDVLSAGGAMSDGIIIAGQPVYWSTMDGSLVAITAQVAFDLVAAAGSQQALIFSASRTHAAAINAAEDLSDYDVLANWPAVFVE